MTKNYDVFVSYSQDYDERLSVALEGGLKRLGKKWNERRALEVFRDQPSLGASSDLRAELIDTVATSRYLLLLLSPGSAVSPWVSDELDQFLNTHSAERILIVLSEGHLSWDEKRKDWTQDSTIPNRLRGVFTEQPLWVDLRWARDQESDLDMRHSQFRGCVVKLAAPVHGLPPDELEGEDVRAHRKEVRIRRTSAALLGLLLVGVATASTTAWSFREQSAAERRLRTQVEGLNTELLQTNDELDAANNNLATANGELDAANGELKVANSGLERTNTDLDNAKVELEIVNANLASSNDELDATNADLVDANAQLDKTNAALITANGDLESANAMLNVAKNELEDANQQLELAEAQATAAAGTAICANDDLEDALRRTGSAAAFVEGQIDEALAAIRNEEDDFNPFGFVANPPDWDAMRGPLVVRERTFPELEGPCRQRSGYPYKDQWPDLGPEFRSNSDDPTI